MSQPEAKNWLFELFQKDMNQQARWFRRLFFLESAMALTCGYAAIQSLLNYFWGEPFAWSFVQYGIWTFSCLLWADNARHSFKAWRQYQHFILK